MFGAHNWDNSMRSGILYGFLFLVYTPGSCLARTQAEMRVAYVTPFTGSCRACFQDGFHIMLLYRTLQQAMRLHFIQHFLSSKLKRLCSLRRKQTRA